MQKESGNCRKGHIKFGGYDYTIENPAGSFRCSIDADGQVTSVASVRDAEGQEIFPGQQVFLVQGRASGKPKDMLKVAAVDTDGNVTTKHVRRRNVTIGQSVSLGEFKQSRQMQLANQSAVQQQVGQPGTVEEKEESAGRSLTKEEADELLSRMENDAEISTEKELTAETWNETFDENNSIETPIGRVKMGENQISKFFEKNRTREFGMVAPTLSNPDVIIEEKSEAKDGGSERPSSFLFVKTFNRNGEKIKFYASVTVKQDGLEVSVSSHYGSVEK